MVGQVTMTCDGFSIAEEASRQAATARNGPLDIMVRRGVESFLSRL